ncbi:MAG TPA: hypothetical protein VIH29_03675 [Gallionella sp.]
MSATTGKNTSSTSVNLLGLLLAKQGKQSTASQLAKFQQNAARKRERFESAVNNAWSTTLKGKK